MWNTSNKLHIIILTVLIIHSQYSSFARFLCWKWLSPWVFTEQHTIPASTAQCFALQAHRVISQKRKHIHLFNTSGDSVRKPEFCPCNILCNPPFSSQPQWWKIANFNFLCTKPRGTSAELRLSILPKLNSIWLVLLDTTGFIQLSLAKMAAVKIVFF